MVLLYNNSSRVTTRWATQAAGAPFPVDGPTFMKIYQSVIESMDTDIPAIARVGLVSMQADNALHRMMHGTTPA